MAVISNDVDARYWIVTDVDNKPDGSFDINLKQVADYQGNPMAMRPAPRKTVNRPATVATGTIIKVTETVTIDRTLTVNPTS